MQILPQHYRTGWQGGAKPLWRDRSADQVACGVQPWCLHHGSRGRWHCLGQGDAGTLSDRPDGPAQGKNRRFVRQIQAGFQADIGWRRYGRQSRIGPAIRRSRVSLAANQTARSNIRAPWPERTSICRVIGHNSAPCRDGHGSPQGGINLCGLERWLVRSTPPGPLPPLCGQGCGPRCGQAVNKQGMAGGHLHGPHSRPMQPNCLINSVPATISAIALLTRPH